MNENNVKNWYECYGEGWTTEIISPQSFSHPAKYSRALIRRIYEYAIEQGYLEPGSWVVVYIVAAAVVFFSQVMYGHRVFLWHHLVGRFCLANVAAPLAGVVIPC